MCAVPSYSVLWGGLGRFFDTDQSTRTTSFLQVVAVPGVQGLIMNWGTVMIWCPCAFPWTQFLSLCFSAVVHWAHSEGSDRAQVLLCLEGGQDMWSELISDWTSHRPSYDQREGPLKVRWSRKQGAVRRIQGDKNYKVFGRDSKIRESLRE